MYKNNSSFRTSCLLRPNVQISACKSSTSNLRKYVTLTFRYCYCCLLILSAYMRRVFLVICSQNLKYASFRVHRLTMAYNGCNAIFFSPPPYCSFAFLNQTRNQPILFNCMLVTEYFQSVGCCLAHVLCLCVSQNKIIK